MDTFSLWLTLLAWLTGSPPMQPETAPALTQENPPASAETKSPAKPAASEAISGTATKDTATEDTATEDTATGDLRVRILADGIPTGKAGEKPKRVVQVITIARDGKRIVLDQFDESKTADGPEVLTKRVLVYLDEKPVTFELDGSLSTYQKHAGDLNRLQRDRDVWEKEFRRKVARLDKDERDALMKENHVNPTGKREVDINYLQGKTIQDRSTQRLVVKENGRTIVDAYVTDEIEGGRSFFDLYRRLGAFSEEVLRELQHVKGFPLQGKITVVAKLAVHTFEFRVEDVERVDAAETLFALPSGAKEVKPLPNRLPCAFCKKVGERKRMTKAVYRREIYYVCNPKCRIRLLDKLAKDAFKKK